MTLCLTCRNLIGWHVGLPSLPLEHAPAVEAATARALFGNLQSWFLGAVRRTNLVQAPGPQLRRTSPCPEPYGFGTYHRVKTGIETGAASKDLDRNDGFLQFVIFAGQMPFHDKSRKTRQALVTGEAGAPQDPLQLPPHNLPLCFERRHWFENTSCFQ